MGVTAMPRYCARASCVSECAVEASPRWGSRFGKEQSRNIYLKHVSFTLLLVPFCLLQLPPRAISIMILSQPQQSILVVQQ